jgi:hypothetical protein
MDAMMMMMKIHLSCILVFISPKVIGASDNNVLDMSSLTYARPTPLRKDASY